LVTTPAESFGKAICMLAYHAVCLPLRNVCSSVAYLLVHTTVFNAVADTVDNLPRFRVFFGHHLLYCLVTVALCMSRVLFKSVFVFLIQGYYKILHCTVHRMKPKPVAVLHINFTM